MILKLSASGWFLFSFIMICMVGLMVMSIFGGGSLIWLICPTPSVICWPYCLRSVVVGRFTAAGNHRRM
jgi:hypothetical protein